MSLETEIRKELTNRGAAFVHFVDVAHLPGKQNKGLNTAILFGLPLTPGALPLDTIVFAKALCPVSLSITPSYFQYKFNH